MPACTALPCGLPAHSCKPRQPISWPAHRPAAPALHAGSASQHGTLDILKAHFDAAYEGNRAPFPLYVHPFFLREGNNLEQLQEFAGGWCKGCISRPPRGAFLKGRAVTSPGFCVADCLRLKG